MCFQAVSNWERGASMRISAAPELAEAVGRQRENFLEERARKRAGKHVITARKEFVDEKDVS